MQGKIRHSGPIGRAFKDSNFSWIRYWATRYVSSVKVVTTSGTEQTITATIVGTAYDGVSYEYSTDNINFTVKGTATGGIYNATGLTENTLYYWRARLYKGTNYGTYCSSTYQPTRILLTQSTSLAYFSGLDTIRLTGAPLIASSVAGTNCFSRCRRIRLTGPGRIRHIKFNFQTLTGRTEVIFAIWRSNGTTYDKLYEESILAKISAGNSLKEIDLAQTVTVREGDYISIRIAGGTTSAMTGLALGIANATHYYIGTNPGTPKDWNAETAITDATPVYCYGDAPLIIGIGDSIMESYPHLTSMVDTMYNKEEVTKSWMYKFYDSDNRFIYSCCGAGGNTTTAIQARFTRDVVNKFPKYVVINGGFNDISAGIDATAKNTFITKWTAMLDACNTNSIVPIVWKMGPWTGATNAQMQARDDWNASLVTLFNTYSISGKVIIDFDEMGKFRAGGDVGNKWDIIDEYNDDDQHLTEKGQAKLAEITLREIGKVWALAQ